MNVVCITAETISAVLCVLSLFGYPGAKVEEKVDIRAAVALEMEPDDIQWMKVGVALHSRMLFMWQLFVESKSTD